MENSNYNPDMSVYPQSIYGRTDSEGHPMLNEVLPVGAITPEQLVLTGAPNPQGYPRVRFVSPGGGEVGTADPA